MPRTDRASRVIAPPERVYAAFVDPDALVACSTAGDDRELEHFDPRPGGSYRLVLTYADPSPAPGKASLEPEDQPGQGVST